MNQLPVVHQRKPYPVPTVLETAVSTSQMSLITTLSPTTNYTPLSPTFKTSMTILLVLKNHLNHWYTSTQCHRSRLCKFTCRKYARRLQTDAYCLRQPDWHLQNSWNYQKHPPKSTDRNIDIVIFTSTSSQMVILSASPN